MNHNTRGTTQIAALRTAASGSDKPYPVTWADERRLLANGVRASSSEVIGHRSSCCRFAPTTGSLKAVCPTVFVIVFADLNLPLFYHRQRCLSRPCEIFINLAVIHPLIPGLIYWICSAVFAVSMPAAPSSPSSRVASSRILYLRILPAAFIGKASTKRIYFGTLCRARLALI